MQPKPIERTDMPIEKAVESQRTASVESARSPDDILISQVLQELIDIHADGAVANLIEMPVVRNLPSMVDLARPLQDEVLHALSRLHQVEMTALEGLSDRSEADLTEGILQEDGSNLFHVSIYNQFERHSDAAVKNHLNPIVSELEVLNRETDTLTVEQYSKLESLQFQLRHISESNKEFHTFSMLATLQRLGGLTIVDQSSGEPYRGDRFDMLASGATIKLIPRHQDIEKRLAKSRAELLQEMPSEITTELANQMVELKVREASFGIFSEDWSEELNRQAVSESEDLGVPAAHDLPKALLDAISTAPPFDYGVTLQAVSEVVTDPAQLRGIEDAREASREANSTLLSDSGEPAMTYVAKTVEIVDPLLSVEAESKVPSLSMPMADFRRALMAAKYIGDEHLANNIDAALNSSPDADTISLPESFHNQAQETLDLARAKQQKAFADVIVPLASKLLKTATNAGLVTKGRDVTAFEGKNYSIRRRGEELKVYCHATDGFIHAKDNIPIQNRNLSKQDRETFKRFSSKSAAQLRASVPKKEQSAGLDSIR